MLPGLNRRRAICATGMGLLAALVAESCDKAPLFAPTGSTITLTASRLASAGNGDTELVATVIEQSGTPVQNGTTVIFTTTLGTIEPREARTKGGTATAILRAGAQSGTATVSAFSGSTRADDITIEIAVTQTVILSVTPESLPSSGGVVTLIAVVHDANGNPLQGISVVFTADAGVLSNTTAVTDSNGEARTFPDRLPNRKYVPPGHPSRPTRPTRPYRTRKEAGRLGRSERRHPVAACDAICYISGSSGASCVGTSALGREEPPFPTEVPRRKIDVARSPWAGRNERLGWVH